MVEQNYSLRWPAVVMTSFGIVMNSSAALAHHPLAGEMPTTFWHGFLSGIGHPMIGFDHFAFIVAAGIATAFVANRLLMPVLFVIATIAGCLLKSGLGVSLPLGEFIIAASVIAIGAIAMSAKPVNSTLIGTVFIVAGLFHGGAYAEAIVGAEPSPLTAYLIGFGFIQATIMLSAMAVTRMLSDSARAIGLKPRFAGAVVAGIGAAFLVENVEGVLFPGV